MLHKGQASFEVGKGQEWWGAKGQEHWELEKVLEEWEVAKGQEQWELEKCQE